VPDDDEDELLELDELELLLDEVEPVEELDELELEELLEELVEPVVEVLELEDELLLELLDVEPPEPFGMEHSFTPPGTLVPAPKVTSPQTKLPPRTLKVKRSARP
jgi:hypothetical protein